MSHIFITGASGYIGSVLATLCVSKGHNVHALSRTPQSDTHLSSLGAIPIRGDLTTYDILTREARLADITINIADAIAGMMGKIDDAERTRINNGALTALAKGIEDTDKKLVLTSGSLFAAADPEGKETNEDSPGWEGMPFGVGLESMYPELMKRGLNVNVVRLAPWVYGRGGSGVKLFMSGAAQAGVMTIVGDGEKRTSTVHVNDAARLYYLVATKAPPREIYNATSQTDVTIRQLAEAMGSTLGVEVKSLSFEQMKEVAGVFLATFLSIENRGSSEKAKRELRWRTGADKGILEEIEKGSYVDLAEELKATMGKA